MSIEILTLFNGWKRIDADRAKEFAKTIMNGAVALTQDQKLQYINSRLKGIQFNSLSEIF